MFSSYSIATFLVFLKISSSSSDDEKEFFTLQVPVCLPVEGNINSGIRSTLKPAYSLGYERCTGMKYNFPNDNQITDYVRYRSYVPRMKEATFCAWLEVASFTGISSFVSYAVVEQNNEFLINFQNPSTLRFNVGGKYAEWNIPSIETFDKIHVCVWYSSMRSQRALYINGEATQTVSTATSGIRGGGDLIFGQEQDDTNAGRLDPSQSFTGSITNLMIWPRVLSDVEIINISRKCECPSDYAITMGLDRVELHGNVKYRIPTMCPILE